MLQLSRVSQSGNHLLAFLSLVSLLGLLTTITASPIKLAPAGAALYTRSIEPSIETKGDDLISTRDLGSKTPTYTPPSVWLNPKDTPQAEGITGTASQGPKRKREIGNLALACPEGKKEGTCVINIPDSPNKRSEMAANLTPRDADIHADARQPLAKRKQATIACCVPDPDHPAPDRTPEPQPTFPDDNAPKRPIQRDDPVSLGQNPGGQDVEDS